MVIGVQFHSEIKLHLVERFVIKSIVINTLSSNVLIGCLNNNFISEQDLFSFCLRHFFL